MRKSSANTNANNGGGSGGGHHRDGGGADSDSDDFVVKENRFQEDEDVRVAGGGVDKLTIRRDGEADEDENNQHGALVQKILESKEQLDYERTKEVNKIFID